MKHLTVLAGPTAVGKGTVSRRLLALHPEIYLSVSATTRDPRPGEVDGVHYHFLTAKQFEEAIANDEFLEYAVVHGTNKYGTLKQPILDAINEGHPALLEIDIQGARLVKQSMPDATLVFLTPPTFEDLVERLGIRGTETPEEAIRRLNTAREELEAEDEFDYVVVNDIVDNAVENIAQIMGL